MAKLLSYRFSSEPLTLRFIFEGSRINVLGVEVMFVAVSPVTWPGELWVEELSTVDLADMLGIPVHVQLGLHLLESFIEGVV